MMLLKKIAVIILIIVLIISFGIFLGFKMYNESEQEYNTAFDNNMITPEQNIEISSLEISNIDEVKTTPNTLVIYKTYYTKCKHYIQRYEDIDISLVNLNEEEYKERVRGWNIDKFSTEEVELLKEEEAFCDEHYKLKLENDIIVIYKIKEDGTQVQYEQTEITTEYLTNEDILRLKTGIEVYGKENLSNTIEDYE